MTKLRMSAAVLMLTLCGVAGAKAQSDAAHVLDAMFYNFDENRDGVIDAREANRFIANSFAEMDPGHSGQITRKAFRAYSFGLADVAAQQGDAARYDAAKDAIFNGWSHGRDTLTLAGYRTGVLADARAAMKTSPRATRSGKRRLAPLRVNHRAFNRIPFIARLMRALQ